MAKSIKKASTTELLAEVNRRQRTLPKLQKERTRLLAKLDKVESRIAELGGSARGPGRPRKATGGTRRPRAKNEISLADALVKAVKSGPPMKIAQIVTAVKRQGYKSNSPQFRNIVTQRLAADKRFKRVERGLYTRA